MEPFLYYLLRATIVTALFYGFYKLLFSKVTFYAINRLSLLGVLLIVIALPMFRFNLLPEPKEEIITVPIETALWDLSQLPVTEVVPTQSLPIPWMPILIALYAVGVLFFAGRYFIGMFQLNGIIRKSEKQPLADGATLCITDTNIAPFSWFKYIVLSRIDHSVENRAILHHERAHIRLYHSVDRLFADIFTVVFWFNPFAWLLRRELQSVHEFQADEAVITYGIDAKQYQILLIRKSVGETKFALANNFLRRDLQKRIRMIMKNKTNNHKKWAYAIGIPVLAFAMIALSIPKLNAKEEVKPNPEKTLVQSGDTISEEFKDIIIREGDKKYTYEDIRKMSPKGRAEVGISITKNHEKITVSGLVIDEAGKPMPKVLIANEADNFGTVSDAHGKFTLKIKKAETVSFKMIGYKEQKVTFTKPETNFRLTLEKGEGKSKELITVNIEGRDNVSNDAQDKSEFTVSGIVKDKNELIPGVAVLIKGSRSGTVTDLQGHFSLKAKKDDVLSFMIFGYKSMEYKVQGAQNNLVIVLKPDENKAKNNTGTLKVRDTNETLFSMDGKKPIYILDGVEINDDNFLKNLHPKDIHNISILKDKTAIEKYGEKGKNGVVSITTKSKKSDDNVLELKGKPLIVIDGERQPESFKLNSFPVDKIESMSILKDKSATELYGDEGKNGVIMITSKK